VKARALLTISFVGLSSAALAQAPAPSPAPSPSPSPHAVDETRMQIVEEIVKGGRRASDLPNIKEPFANRVADFQGEIVSYLLAVHAAQKATYKTLLDSMAARVDKQVGSSSGSAGSTSLATKGAVPEILGAAVEQGAFERTVTGTTVTFRAKPVGIIKFLQSNALLDMYTDYTASSGARFARRFSGAASFDTSRGASAGTFTAGTDQFSGWSVRCEVINQRDAALARYASQWRTLKVTAYAKATDKLHDALSGWAPFKEWRDHTIADVRAQVEARLDTDHDKEAAAKRFQAVLEADLPLLEKLPVLPPDVESALDAYVAQLTAVETGIGDIYAFANKGALLTVEFTTLRDPKLPDLYTATGVLEVALGAARKTDLTVNGEASYYSSLPQGVSQKLKNVAFSAELAHPVASLLGLRGTTFSLAARYSYLPNDTVASGAATGQTTVASGAAAAPKGSIGVVQAKLTLPVKGSGVKVPLSVTFANRTEVIKESVVRANFGVTFDLDTLLAASKAGK
jgi:hypothetical protein